MKRLMLLPILYIGVTLAATSLGYSGERVKDFTLPSARENNLVRLSDYSGKVVLINWFRTSCGFCHRESPRLVELYNKYRDLGLVILGVSDDNTESVRDIPGYLSRYGIAWPVGLNDQGEFLQEIVFPNKPNGAGPTPDHYIVTRSGEITYLGHVGSPEAWQSLEEAVVNALADSVPEPPAIEPRKLQDAPSFSLPDLQGTTFKLEDFSGRPLMVHFFRSKTAHWARDAISKLHTDYANRGLQIVGINLFDKEAQIRQYIARYSVEYPILRGDKATQYAWTGSNKGYAVFFVTPDGKILKKIINSINNGIEELVFRKYAEVLLAKLY